MLFFFSVANIKTRAIRYSRNSDFMFSKQNIGFRRRWRLAGSCDITIWQQMLAINAKNLPGQRVIHDSDVSETILPVEDVGRRILYFNVDRAWT